MLACLCIEVFFNQYGVSAEGEINARRRVRLFFDPHAT